MTAPVDSRALGQIFVGAVTESVRLLAEKIEGDLQPDENWSGEPQGDLVLSCGMFVLHLTDRIAFAYLAPAGHHLFMSTLLETVAERGGREQLRAEYNISQR